MRRGRVGCCMGSGDRYSEPAELNYHAISGLSELFHIFNQLLCLKLVKLKRFIACLLVALLTLRHC